MYMHVCIRIGIFVLNNAMENCLYQIYLFAPINKQKHCFQILLVICVKIQQENRPQPAEELLLINLSVRR